MKPKLRPVIAQLVFALVFAHAEGSTLPSQSDLSGDSLVLEEEQPDARGALPLLFPQDFQATLDQLTGKVNPLRTRNAQLKRYSDAITNATVMCQQKVPLSGLTRLGGNYYYIETRTTASQKKDFQEANAQCRAYGMQLATLETAAENVLVKTKLVEIFAADGILAANSVSFYIGLNDLAVGLTHTWVGDGSTITYTPEFGAGAAAPTCTRITLTADPATFANVNWQDLQCTTALRFVCELPKICQSILKLPN